MRFIHYDAVAGRLVDSRDGTGCHPAGYTAGVGYLRTQNERVCGRRCTGFNAVVGNPGVATERKEVFKQ